MKRHDMGKLGVERRNGGFGSGGRRSGGQQGAASLVEIAQREEKVEPGGVLEQSAVAHPRVAPKLFDDPERELHLRAHARFVPGWPGAACC